MDQDHHLQQRVIDVLGLVDNGETVAFNFNINQARSKTYEVSKKTLYKESKYFRACFIARNDPFPKATVLLQSPHNAPSLRFILSWLNESLRIPLTQSSPAEEEPKVSVQEWYQKNKNISFENLAKICVLAEFLRIPRLEEHVRITVYQKTLELMVLPPLAAVKYVYEEGKIFCGLKNSFIDMYAIAAMKPTEVFGSDRGSFPGAFVEEVENYSKEQAYVMRRRKLVNLRCLPEDRASEEFTEEDDDFQILGQGYEAILRPKQSMRAEEA